MSDYCATVNWVRGAHEAYTDSKYSRGHRWIFDGGVTVPASASPNVVPLPYSVEANVDPEEAFVASLSSCHMLFFLSIAAKMHFVVDEYTDDAVGVMTKGSDGRVFMSKVFLRPRVRFSPDRQPEPERIKLMHDQAHQRCFISNSVKTEVITEIVLG